MLILHYTGMESAERAVSWLCTPESRVSCHYLVGERGEITQMVDEGLRAWHAGQSFWKGETDVNSASIGIEIHNRGHGLGYPDFPLVQMEAAANLCIDILSRNPISPQNVLAHSDIAPMRKADPGEKFDWKFLHERGIGHWVPPESISNDTTDLSEMQRLLSDYGYGIEQTGTVTPRSTAVIRAFQRHFRPARVDGVADRSTLETLRKLIGALT
ncbi:MAG: N-acetylmuramoyl-L-alanine amidase [Rhizobiales bacterium]|nr:N-acetylmuramoyl-L-alanine amidase [Hyphomicrobiales bacterium]